jgi:ElaB/YqjD/DUF883 family membrane-anchored ribosome-binding protein
MAEKEVNQDVNALRDDLKQLREDVATIAESLKKVVQGGAKAVLPNQPDDLYGQFKEGYESLRQEGKHARSAVEREIEDRPFTALLGAFIVGIVLGKFMSVR